MCADAEISGAAWTVAELQAVQLVFCDLPTLPCTFM